MATIVCSFRLSQVCSFRVHNDAVLHNVAYGVVVIPKLVDQVLPSELKYKMAYRDIIRDCLHVWEW